MNHRASILLSLSSLLLVSGCVPLAWVTPPARLEAGVAARYGQRPDAAPADEEASLDVAFPLRASLAPLQLFEGKHDRRLDAGAGWELLLATEEPRFHGPFADATFYFNPLHDSSGWRHGVMMRGHLHLGAGGEGPGWGASTLYLVEGVAFAKGRVGSCSMVESDDSSYDDEDDKGSCIFGVAYGESSIGLFLEARYGRLEGADMGFVGGGLLFRSPASAGVGFAFVDPGD